MEVKPGYKQTEVGVIPEEWEVKTFEKLFNFSGGYSASRDQLSSEGHCYLHYGDIHGATKTTVDVRADYQNIPKLNMPLKRVASKSLLEDGDVVFVDASEDDEGTSRHIVVVNKENKPFISGLHTIVAKCKTDELVHEYRRYCFQTAAIRQQFLFYAVGTKVSGISKTNIAKLKLPVPTLPEQRAIAEALSDVDGLLGGLDRLIAKKRDLKQAAMQQLLTGQTRLPGFHGEWEVKTLYELAERKKEFFDDGDWIESEHITTEGIRLIQTGNIGVGSFVEKDDKKYITEASFSSLRCKQLKQGDLLVCRLADPAGRACVLGDIGEERIVTSVDVTIFRPPSELADRLFLSQVFSTSDWFRAVSDRSGGTTHKRISRGALGRLSIKLPPLPEQTAIASVLTEMDGELAALERRRDKTRALKQAMMQELLTGKTRLI